MYSCKVIPYRVLLKLVPSPSSIRSGAAGTLTIQKARPKRDVYEIGRSWGAVVWSKTGKETSLEGHRGIV